MVLFLCSCQVLDDTPTAEDRVAAARSEIQELQASISENNVSKMDMIRRLKVRPYLPHLPPLNHAPALCAAESPTSVVAAAVCLCAVTCCPCVAGLMCPIDQR